MIKVNYSHQKKQRELAQKKKHQEKLKEKLARKMRAEQGGTETAPVENNENIV